MAGCLYAECAFITKLKPNMEKVRETVCKYCKEHVRSPVYWYTVPKALCMVAACGHIKCVKRVLKTTGADVNNLNKALTYSVAKGAHESIDMLIEVGANVNEVNDKNGENILMIASRHGYERAVEVLIRKGADVNSVDKEGNTALILSARQEPNIILCECIQSQKFGLINHFRCVKLLLLAGAHINNYNKYNYNAICENLCWFDVGANHSATHKPETEVYTLLYAAGEMLPDGATSDGEMLITTVERAKRLYHVLFEDLRFDLKHLCRETIRRHLLDLNPHEHLFGRIPRLGLPKLLREYLLFRMSLSEEGPLSLSHDRLGVEQDEDDCQRIPNRFYVFGAACTEFLDPLLPRS